MIKFRREILPPIVHAPVALYPFPFTVIAFLIPS